MRTLLDLQIAREPCADDARGALISLTDEGRTTLRQAAPLHVSSVRRHMVGLLTADEIAMLDTIAGTIIAHLTDQTPGETPGEA